MKKNQIFIKCGTEYKEMTKELLEACDLEGEIEKKFETKSSLIDNSEAEVDCFYSPDSVEKQNLVCTICGSASSQTWSLPWKPTGVAPPIRR